MGQNCCVAVVQKNKKNGKGKDADQSKMEKGNAPVPVDSTSDVSAK